MHSLAAAAALGMLVYSRYSSNTQTVSHTSMALLYGDFQEQSVSSNSRLYAILSGQMLYRPNYLFLAPPIDLIQYGHDDRRTDPSLSIPPSAFDSLSRHKHQELVILKRMNEALSFLPVAQQHKTGLGRLISGYLITHTHTR